MNNTEQRVLIKSNQYDINEMIDKGWRVTSVTANHFNGYFCFVLEKTNK